MTGNNIHSRAGMLPTFAKFMRRFITLTLLIPSALIAQSVNSPRIGGRIRVTTGADSLQIGNLKSLDVEAVTLFHKGARNSSVLPRSPSAIPMSSVSRLEMSRGRSGSGERILAGTLLGFLGGGAIAALIGSSSTQNCSCDDPGGGILLAVPGALIGGLIGGMIGWSRSPERWESIDIPGRASQ
jgi:hypothetical protein